MSDNLLKRVGSVRLYVGATVVVGLLVAAATVAQMVFLSRVIDRVFLGGGSLPDVRGPLLWLLGAVAVRAGLVWAREVTAQRGAGRAKREVRERLLSHVFSLGPAYAAGERSGELATTVTEGVERLEPYFTRYLPQVALSALVPLLVAAYIIPRDLASAVLLVVSAPVIPLMMILVGSYAEEHTRRQWVSLSRLGAYFLDSLQGLTTLKVFGGVGAGEESLARASDEFRRRTLRVLRFAFLSGLVLEFMTAAAIALVAVTLGVRLINGAIAFEQAFLVLLLAPEFYRPLRELGASRHAGMEGKAAAERIFEILDTPAPVHAGTRRTSGHLSGALSVELSGVSFSYPARDIPALSGLDLTLPAGSRTAVVGPSGSGKSTLVNLLLRFLDPDAGTIAANGLRITDLPVGVWREYVALVPQRPHLFYGSVLDNIRLARPGASRAEVEAAAELAGAVDFICALPLGYDTQVGERGLLLSGGEAQRVAIARAFLKDAPLLVLDEPTSSLDPESEALIGAALGRLARGRTTLVVAHRLNTARASERIAVLDEGRLEDVGTHAELLTRGGTYARLALAYGDVPA
ncbi:MAG TPA: thiol reductant ABC exporter subunit CydD [Rubrobacteraceae bacterium]|nr:thiol reductant ABC exporter subunit CydD [Rubrobacteraceae bacterium]